MQRRPSSKYSKRPAFGRKKRCRLCGEHRTEIDYKDLPLVQRYCRQGSKILARKRTGACAKHQRMVKRAIKLARFMALLPYVT
ncbi:30S ribosomal protein S18 [Planctomycetota bacterium]